MVVFLGQTPISLWVYHGLSINRTPERHHMRAHELVQLVHPVLP